MGFRPDRFRRRHLANLLQDVGLQHQHLRPQMYEIHAPVQAQAFIDHAQGILQAALLLQKIGIGLIEPPFVGLGPLLPVRIQGSQEIRLGASPPRPPARLAPPVQRVCRHHAEFPRLGFPDHLLELRFGFFCPAQLIQDRCRPPPDL
jgi:hypothetical protein